MDQIREDARCPVPALRLDYFGAAAGSAQDALVAAVTGDYLDVAGLQRSHCSGTVLPLGVTGHMIRAQTYLYTSRAGADTLAPSLQWHLRFRFDRCPTGTTNQFIVNTPHAPIPEPALALLERASRSLCATSPPKEDQSRVLSSRFLLQT